jgi:translation initiation factor IF-2
MAKIRVHQLAKEYDLDSKVVMDVAYSHGIEVKNHMSALEQTDEFMLRAYLEEMRRKPAPAPVEADLPPASAESFSMPDEPEPPPPPPPVAKAGPAPAREVRVKTSAPPQPPAPVAPPAPAFAAAAPAPVVDEPSEAPRVYASPATETSFAAEAVAEPPKVAAPPPRQEFAPSATSAPPPAPAPVRPVGPPPRSVTARVGGMPPNPPSAPAPAAPAAPAPPRSITARPGGVAPMSPPLNRPAASADQPPRRTGEILGRREITVRPPEAAPMNRASTGGSGLIVTRQEGNKRTFVMTGHSGYRGARPGAPGAGPRPMGGPPFRGGPPMRGRGPGGPGGGYHQPKEQVGPKKVEIQLPITVKALSEAIGVKVNDLIRKLFVEHRIAAKINDVLDKDTVELLGLEFNAEITVKEAADLEAAMMKEIDAGFVDDPADLRVRAPVVTVLGHVDHGKTSLLDAIRKTTVAAREHGGITQHIGASLVKVGDRSVVFVDTPGHRAFTEMRARGAQVTDVAVLVVAADDGVMPQTKEAVAHAKAAKVPIVVAVTKIDKPGANPMRVRQEMTNEGLQPVEWGGGTEFIDISSVTGQGVQKLLEHLALEADVLELKANPKRPATGTCLEAEQSRGEGNIARVLVQNGTLRKGDVFLCGVAYGRVRAIKNDLGKFVTEVGPATPVEIPGMNELPKAGDRFVVVEDIEKAKELADKRRAVVREQELAKQSHVSLEKLFEKLEGDTLKIILKVDVTGSLEVLKKEIADLKHPEIRPEIIHAAVGGITETDVTLADASDAIILGFHVSADLGSRSLAEEKKVEIRIYQVIYKLIEEIRAALEGKLKPEEREKIVGRAEVKQTWKVSRLGTIAGCIVVSGSLKRSVRVRVSRGGIVLKDGELGSLKRVKDDVKEVVQGLECGLTVNNFENIEPGDVIEAYEIEQIKRTLDG